MKLKKIIINGASSYISINLIKKLLNNNCEVYAITRNKNFLLKEIKNSRLHIYAYLDVDEIPKKVDAFLYFAWLNSDSFGRSNIDMQKENIDFAITQINFIKSLDCKKILFANSFYVKELNSLFLEKTELINPKYNYAIFKETVSDLLRANLNNKNVVDLYISNVFGPFEKNKRFITYIFDCFKKHCNINLSNMNYDFLYDFIYIDDAIDLIYKIAINKNKYNSYDICSNDPQPFIYYIREMIKSLKLDNNMIKYDDSAFPSPDLKIEDFRFEQNNREYNFLCKYTFKEGINMIKKSEVNASKINKR